MRRFLEEWIADVRLALRRSAKAPGFTVGAILILALGIGATTAIFSVASAVMFRPLPYPEPDRLLAVGQSYKSGRAGAGEPKFLFWREHATSFEGMAAYSSYGGAGGNLTGAGEPEFVAGLRVSADFLRVLGVGPSIGRGFVREDDVPGSPRVAILSDSLWRRRFDADPGVIGRRVTLDDEPLSIVGVLPPSFAVGPSIDLLLPMQATPTAHHDPNATVVGRLRPGVDLAAARAELRALAERYRALAPGFMSDGESVDAQPYQELFTGGRERLFAVLLGAAAFLLLIACANVAHLQLTRATVRSREFAIRSALGGGALRMARQLTVESLVIALAAGVTGLAIAVWGARTLVALMPDGYLSAVTHVVFDWRVLAFAFLAALVSGILAGLAPVAQGWRVDLVASLKQSGERSGGDRGRLRGALVVTELALSVALLAGAGLLTRTFANLLNVAPGFDPSRVLTFEVTPRGLRYDSSGKVNAFVREGVDRLAQVPGVSGAAVVNKLPLDWQFNMPVFLDSAPRPESLQVRVVTPDYFRVMEIALRSGRGIESTDSAGAPGVAVVNEAFLRRFEGETSTRRLTIGRGLGEASRAIVGVVGDFKQTGLGDEAPPTLFVPVAQASDRFMGVVRTFTGIRFVIKTTTDPGGVLKAARKEMAAVDPTLAISGVARMEDLAARSVAPERFNMVLVGAFGMLALALALGGVYSVMAYAVAQQRRDIGVRMALGATSGDVVHLVVGQTLRLALTGLGSGILLFVALSSALQSLLFEVGARDPLVLVTSAGALLVMALGAAYLPARRAANSSPVAALRQD